MLLLQHFTKTCSKCKEIKTLGNFNIRNKSKDGYTARCKECTRDYDKTRKDERSRNHKIRYNENKTKILKKQKEYYYKNRDRIIKRHMLYNRSPIGVAIRKNTDHKRRAIIKSDSIDTSEILQLQNNAKICYWCGVSLRNVKVHLDHYIPISKGGLHTISNLVISCSKCNLSKGAKDPLEFAITKGKLL